jgi:hypothetical protein
MKTMKKHLFLMIAAAAGFALPNTLQAQWGFTVTQGQRGNCSGCGDIKITVINFGSIPVSGFPTKQECEAARQYLAGISQSFVCGCTLYVRCSACTGKDIAGFGVGVDGSVNTSDGSVRVNGTSQGSSYYTPNTFDALQDAYDQKTFQNEVLLETDKNEIVFYNGISDKSYIEQVKKIQFTGGRSLGWVDRSHVSQGTYKGTLQDLMAKPAGLNVADYFSEAEWNRCSNSRAFASDACKGFREQYNKFAHDVLNNQKKQDPIFNVVDEAWASTKEKVKEDAIIRAQGAMQALGGAFGVVSGYTIATGGEIFAPGVAGVAGAIVAADGADNLVTGIHQFFTGKETNLMSNAIASKIGLPQNAITRAVGIIDLGTSVHRLSISVFKSYAKPRINAKVVPSNPATVAKIRNSSTTRGGQIMTRNASQAERAIVAKPQSPIRKKALGYESKPLLEHHPAFREDQVLDYVKKSTQNPDKNNVMLGYYQDNNVSYLGEAGPTRISGEEFCFYSNSEYSTLEKIYSPDELFKINEKFIENRYYKGNDFYFSHNPAADIRGSFKKEIDVLKRLTGKEKLNFEFDEARKIWKLIK